MGSSGKKKTTMAKLTRESRLRERRVEKAARKQARKLAAADRQDDALQGDSGEPIEPEAGQSDLEPVVPVRSDA